MTTGRFKTVKNDEGKIKAFGYYYNEKGDYTIYWGEQDEWIFFVRSEKQAKKAIDKLNGIVSLFIPETENIREKTIDIISEFLIKNNLADEPPFNIADLADAIINAYDNKQINK